MSQTLLVTGGAGFVGTNLIKALLDRLPGRRDRLARQLLHRRRRRTTSTTPGSTYIDGSTVDIAKIWAERGLPSPEIVFHLGEYSRIVQSFDDHDLTWEFNLHGTKEVVKFASANGSKLIYAGSSSKFGNDGQDENLNPYAWTKAKNIEYIRNYANWYGLDYAITYFYNVYGPGQISQRPVRHRDRHLRGPVPAPASRCRWSRPAPRPATSPTSTTSSAASCWSPRRAAATATCSAPATSGRCSRSPSCSGRST